MIKVGDEQVPWYEGMTIASLLAEREDGHTYAVVRLNGRLISRPKFESTLIPDNAEVILIPMVAGG
ncbi:MAG: MoaD/ThiS family protein [Deltaproteobacteria bacterium]|nr:MoaD/ThiS family protein [Deltaproteobacteria bacterium]MBW1929845.1 MoaD/ThiS family protein [Deltaproteobacteria bacterium]MBW2024110.1 MoaD/ThiS family protein [Deltaproteobacteria bacterium]MBW2124369.1 MoaD/ThiS family protein [Deltaproteobacteria bacterium]RLB17133.1 MAG: thiamine biosynthesis protein ThiS [Deltaproteobacteria bacterium]